MNIFMFMHQLYLQVADPPDSILQAVFSAVLDHDEPALYKLVLISFLAIALFLLDLIGCKDSTSSIDMCLLVLIETHCLCPFTNFLLFLCDNVKPAHLRAYLMRFLVVSDLRIV